jgi:hypothetical protein
VNTNGDLHVWYVLDASLLSLCLSFPAADLRAPDSLASPISFKTKVRGKVAGVALLKAAQVIDRNETQVTGIGSVGWVQDGEHVRIKNVAGLGAGGAYRLTVAVFGE